MNTASRETPELDELLKSLEEKLGRRELVEEVRGQMMALLDEEGMALYVRLVDEFLSLDRALSLSLLNNGAALFGSMKSPALRREVLEVILDMGRSKWSVVQKACRILPDLSGVDGDTTKKWLHYGNALAGIDQDVAIQYFDASFVMLMGRVAMSCRPMLVTVTPLPKGPRWPHRT